MRGTAIDSRTVEVDDRTLAAVADAGGQAWIADRAGNLISAELAWTDGRYVLVAAWDLEPHSTVEVRVRGALEPAAVHLSTT